MAGSVTTKLGFAGTAVLVRAGRATVQDMKYINEDAAIRFCQVFDAATAASVTVGTTVPAWILVAGVNGTDETFGGDIIFDRGIVVAGTTTATGSTGAASGTQHFFVVTG